MEPVEVEFLPDEQKKEVCLDLLREFGADRVRIRGDELQHNCTLGLGGHTDNNSFAASVNYHLLRFNCYVCGYGGSLTWWIAVNRRLDTDSVELWLKKRLGIGTSLPINDLLRVIDSICHPPTQKRVLPTYPERILDRWTSWGMFHPYLTDPIQEGGRGIPEKNLERFKIGYADEDEEFGLYQRIIIPVYWEGHLVGWQGRRLSPDDPHPEKYRNSPDFPRDTVLYGDTDRRSGSGVVVESPFSVLQHCHQRKHVATLGSNITPEQLRALERRYSELIIATENDKAGWKMTRKLINSLSRSVRLSVWNNPYAKEFDPSDIDDDTYENMLDQAVPAAAWAPKTWDQQIPYIRPGKG